MTNDRGFWQQNSGKHLILSVIKHSQAIIDEFIELSQQIRHHISIDDKELLNNGIVHSDIA